MSDNHKMVRAEDITIESEEIEQAKDLMHPLVRAVLNGSDLDVDKLERLMDLQRRYEAQEAKVAYDQAMVKLKKHMPSIIGRDGKADYPSKKGGRVKYSFATLSKIIEQVEPHLSEYGFSISWIPSTTESTVTVTCRLRHIGGHSEEATMTGPHDTSGSKNPLQAMFSTQTYMERYSVSAILGVVSEDMPDADDRKNDGTTIDSDKNLRAVTWMSKNNISIEQAVAHVGRGVDQWTGDDLAAIKELVKKTRRGPDPVEPTEQSPIMQGMFEAARAVFDDKALDTVSNLCSTRGLKMGKLTDDQCAAITVEINKLADAE